jgi:hypothetical protein
VFGLLEKAIVVDNTHADIDKFLDIHQYLSLYKIWSNKINKEIDEVAIEKIKKKNFMHKITRVYKHYFNERLKALIVIQKFLRNSHIKNLE